MDNNLSQYTAQKMKFSIKDFFSKCDQIRSFQQIDRLFLRFLFSAKLTKYFSFAVNTCKSFSIIDIIPE